MAGPKTKSVYASLAKYLSPEDMERAIKATDELLGPGVASALCGGVAMQIYGSSRLTQDVDFVVDNVSVADYVSGFDGTPLSFGGVRIQVAGVNVDLICRHDEYKKLYDEALRNALSTDDTGLGVVGPEFLMAMKMAAGRGKDIQDFNTLACGSEVNIDVARDVVRQFLGLYGAKEFDSMVALARLEKKDQE